MYFYGKESLKVNHHTTKFRGDKHCGGWDKMFLLRHVIAQDDVMKGPCDFMSRSPLRWASILPISVAIGTVV